MFESFGKTAKENRRWRTSRVRSLRLEKLENRELLSVAPWDAATEPASETALVASVEAETFPTLDLSPLSAPTNENASTTGTYVVTTNLDVVDANDGVLSLREAISDAPTGATIAFDPSLKGATITLSGTQLAINKGITVDASALYDATNGVPGIAIDANELSRVLYLSGGTDANPLALIGLTITGGKVGGSGGGVYVADGTTNFANCSIVGNRVESTITVYGGGVYVESGTAGFANCSIAENAATSFGARDNNDDGIGDARGGGVYVNVAETTFTECSIDKNVVTSQEKSVWGGGVYVEEGTTTFDDTTVSNNVGDALIMAYGGGVCATGTTTYKNSTISGNVLTVRDDGVSAIRVLQGGGVSAYGTSTFQETTISGNTANGGSWYHWNYGGGVAVYGTASFLSSTISGNRLTSEAVNASGADNFGGGVYVGAGNVAFDNSTISSNIAGAVEHNDGCGGGVYVEKGTTTFRETSIVSNLANGCGGGVYVETGTTDFNKTSILWNDASVSGDSRNALGGGVYVADGTTTFVETKIRLNTAEATSVPEEPEPHQHASAYGGGFYLGGTSTFIDTTISDNDAIARLTPPEQSGDFSFALVEANGGGGWVSGTSTFINTTVTNNNASEESGYWGAWDDATSVWEETEFWGYVYGGGLCVGGDSTIINTEIANNAVSTSLGEIIGYSYIEARGGGLYVSGAAAIINTTITRNYASAWFSGDAAGGGAYVESWSEAETTFYNSIVAGNDALDWETQDVGGWGAAAHHTISSYEAWANANENGVVNYLYDASLPLFTDGGRNDFTLAADSQALNKGRDVNAMFADGNPVPFDKAGNKRLDGTVDLGAYERPSGEPTAPRAATEARASYDASRVVTLTWTDVADDETGYEIEKKVDGVWVAVATTPSNATSVTFEESELTAGAWMEYRVAPTNDCGRAPWTTFGFVVQSLVVTTNSDVVDDKDGLTSLREAIAYSESNPALGGVVTFAPSLKGATILLNGSQLEITKGIKIDASALYDEENNAPGITVNADKKSGVFKIDAGDGSNDFAVELIGLTITGGNVWGSGGGAYANAATTFTDCAIIGNKSSSAGGGVYACEEAIFNNCAIEGNEAPSSSGGGVYANETTTFNNTVIANNKALAGGHKGGGGVYARGVTTFNNCAITGNAARGQGGGVYASNDAELTMIGCVVSGNTAEWGAGAMLWGVSTWINVEVVGNAATSGGGGLYLGKDATVCNATVAGNQAGWAGGLQIQEGALATICNTIVATNLAPEEPDFADVYSEGTTAAYNALSGYSAWDSGENQFIYNASLPLFNDAENGDYALAENSQALNKGNDVYAVDAQGTPLTTDLAGNPRFAGTVDLGAYERALPPLGAPNLTLVIRDATSLTANVGYVSYATSYGVEYSTDPTFETFATKTFSSSGAKKISGLSPNATYYVRVKAFSDGTVYGDSGWSETVSATTPALPLATPTLAVEPRDATSLTVTIGYVSGATSFSVEYSSDPTFETYATRTYLSSGVKRLDVVNQNAPLYVRVKADGEGAYVDSERSDATTVAPTPTLNVSLRDATSLTATIGYVSGATAYNVDYSTDATFATYSTKTFSTNGAKKISGLTPNATYYVRVSAVAPEGCVDSQPSTAVSATIPALPLATPTFAVEARDASSLTLTIGYVSGATSYSVEYSSDPTFATLAARTFTSSGAKKLSGLETATTYYVRVKSDGTGAYADSSWSDAATGTTCLDAPTLAAGPRSSASLTLVFPAVDGATSYVVEYSTDAEFASSSTKVYAAAGTRSLNGLNAATTYYIRVKSVATGVYPDSLWSDVVKATTPAETSASSDAALTDEVFASSFDDFGFDFFLEDDEDKR